MRPLPSPNRKTFMSQAHVCQRFTIGSLRTARMPEIRNDDAALVFGDPGNDQDERHSGSSEAHPEAHDSQA